MDQVHVVRPQVIIEGCSQLPPSPDYNYLPGPDDIYVSPSQIRTADRRHGLRSAVRPPKDGERYFALIKVEAVNFEAPDLARNKLFFENLTFLYPQERLKLETGGANMSARGT